MNGPEASSRTTLKDLDAERELVPSTNSPLPFACDVVDLEVDSNRSLGRNVRLRRWFRCGLSEPDRTSHRGGTWEPCDDPGRQGRLTVARCSSSLVRVATGVVAINVMAMIVRFVL